MDIYDYTSYPTADDWDRICEFKKEAIKKLNIQSKTKINGFDFVGMELNSWLKDFNNRIFDLINSYVMMMHYHDKGIPDDRWYISPGLEGQSLQYFPDFEEKNYIHHYWFGYYMEHYYSKYSSIIDSIYHLINIKFCLSVGEGLGFIGKVLKGLETKDYSLYEFFKGIKDDETYIKINKFRNDLTHNFRPNQIDSGLSQKKDELGRTVITMSVGNYVKTSEFISNINESIDFLSNIIEKIKEVIEN